MRIRNYGSLSSLPLLRTAQETVRSFSASGRALFYFFSALLLVSSLGLVYLLNERLLVSVPAHGGSFTEGVIGSPRFINPLLATSDSDRDLTMLVYSGLLKATPKGSYTPDLASGYTISPDGKTYTVTLRPGVTFHDGVSVTAEDVLFTVQKAQNAAIKSPLATNWSGVVASAPDAHTVVFVLRQAYTPFIENLTLGILPKHLWESVADDAFTYSTLNASPIGSGPFAVTGIARNTSGVPTSYTLHAFARYALGEPYLTEATLRFYQSQNELVSALRTGAIDAASGISPSTLASITGKNILQAPLNRIFGVFFNQNQSEVLRDSAVRQALGSVVDRNALIQSVLLGYGVPLTSPLPPSIYTPTPGTTSPQDPAARIAAAAQTLQAAGWVAGPDGIRTKQVGSGKTAKTETLSFSLATGDVPELRAAAQYLETTWGKLGAKVDVGIYDQGDLSQNVIRPRKYDALLFGEVVGRQPDLFAFWDSSQRVDPGLNIALYANPTVDSLVENLRTASADTQAALYAQFSDALAQDTPAIFLYAPDFVYIMPKDLAGVTIGSIETSSDRFLSIAEWYTQTDSVWPLFAKRVHQ